MSLQHGVTGTPSTSNDVTSMARYFGPPPLMLQLVLDHNCQHQGCSDAACAHCKYSSTRRCSSQLRPKYVSGELLLAGCGAAPEVQLVPAQGAMAAGQLLLPGWQLQVQLLDNAAFEAQTARQTRPLSMQQLASCIETGRALLKCRAGKAASCITLPLQAGRACLSGLRCVKPEHPEDGKRQNGKTTRFRLLFTLTASSPQLPATCNTPGSLQGAVQLVSNAFTVVTTRSRSAVKSEVPLPDEAVSRLQGIGKDAAASLKALRALAGQQVEPVETVGHFYALHQWVTQGGTERLQQLLNTTGIKPADFKLAAEHVQHTAFPDFRPRIWWQQGQGRGLLCSWNQAETAPGAPLAWALQQQQQEGLAYVLAPHSMPGCMVKLQQVLQLALQDWSAAGHGSWEVCWCDAADPLAQGWWAQGMPFNVQALPVGILNAVAAAGAGIGGLQTAVAAGPAAAAAPASAGFGVQVVLPPVQQQQQQELPAAPAALQPAQQALQLQQPPPTPTLPLEPYVAPLPQQQQQVLNIELQQPWQQLSLQPQQTQLQLQLGPQYLLPIPCGPATPSCLSELLMPASETAAGLLVQLELLAQTSDASTLLDQHLQQQQQQQQQPQKRQKLMQQEQQAAAEQGADVSGVDVCVLSARPDTVTGPDDDARIELPGIGFVVVEERQLSLDRLLSLEDLEALLGEGAARYDD